jgi:hypothetical protein
VQPPHLPDQARELLIENAKSYWNELGLPNHDASETGECSRDNYEITQSPWPFDEQTSLPSIGHVRQSQDPNNTRAKTTKTKTGKDIGGVGDILHEQRAWRKEVQLANLIECVLPLLPDGCLTPNPTNKEHVKIVDFAGGTGHLAVPLALLLPHCEIVCVDLKKWSLDLLHRRIDGCLDGPVARNSHVHVENEARATKSLPNLFTYYGSIQSYPDSFDIGISLHACGEASDWVLRKCLQKNASFVLCSCCCGKLSRDSANPYTFHSTGGNENMIRYPQSKMFASLGQCGPDRNNTSGLEPSMWHNMTPDMFDEIAKAADYSELGDLRKPRNACRRVAKSLVEWDRLLFAKECLNDKDQADSDSRSANVIITRMLPWEASTKNDILIGWPNDKVNPYRIDVRTNRSIPRDRSCDYDFQTALHHLFGANDSLGVPPDTFCNDLKYTANDWSLEEEEEIELQMKTFIEGSDTQYSFPSGMGSRKRKLIHYVADKLGLVHWGQGKKDRDKYVVIARSNETNSYDVFD